MSNLYELSSEMMELENLLSVMEEAEANEEEIKEVEQIRNIVKEELEKKSSGVVFLAKNLNSDIIAIKEEIKRLQDLKKVKTNKLERIKNFAKEYMEISGIKRVETPLGNLSIRKTKPGVNILDESRIPQEYIKTKIEESIDKTLLLSDLQEGLVLDGVAEIKQGTSLTIK